MGKRIETDHAMCPSAQPGMDQARVLGVVNRTPEGSRVSYLNAALPVTEEVLQLVSPAPLCACSGSLHDAKRSAVPISMVKFARSPAALSKLSLW